MHSFSSLWHAEESCYPVFYFTKAFSGMFLIHGMQLKDLSVDRYSIRGNANTWPAACLHLHKHKASTCPLLHTKYWLCASVDNSMGISIKQMGLMVKVDCAVFAVSGCDLLSAKVCCVEIVWFPPLSHTRGAPATWMCLYLCFWPPEN